MEEKNKRRKFKKQLAGNIQRLRQENGLALEKCTITKRVAEEIFRFDSCWQEPEGLSDYQEFRVASTADDLEKLSLEMLDQWVIERIDKPSPALQEQPATGQLAE